MDLNEHQNNHFNPIKSEMTMFMNADDFKDDNNQEKIFVKRNRRNVKWKVTWKDFTATTTLHGMRYIFLESEFAIRRLIWLFLTLTCLSLMMYQIIDRIIYYYDSPSNVNVKINYNSSLMFPALTLCNQNAFRASSAAKHGWYRLIEDIYGSVGGFDPKQLHKYNANNISVGDLYSMTGHRPEDLIVSCLWGDKPCSWRNFTSVLTDHGLCYTFIAPEMIESTGADHGLKLLLNVEQYEYMPGPHDAAGIKVLTHGPNELPRVRELGISIPTGTHSFVGLQIIYIQNLRHPHGQCSEKTLHYFDEYSYDSCKIECRLEKLNEECGCRDFYMPHIKEKPPVCTLDEYYSCYTKVTDTQHDSLDQCDCPTACRYFVYDPVLSYATTSEFASDKLLDSINISSLGTKLSHAKEVTHRMESFIFNAFRSQIESVLSNVDGIINLINGGLTTKLDDQLAYLEDKYNSTLRVWKKHNFYLQYQLYNIQKNFMRGRDAMEERTLSHLCNSFHEFVFEVESNLRNMVNANYSSSVLRESFYINVMTRIEGRQDTAERALANFTQLYQAYRTGTPIFRYKYKNVKRAHNVYAVPKALMNESTYHNSYALQYSPRLEEDITRMMDALTQYQILVDDVYTDKLLNMTKMHEVSEAFIDSCEDYYHAKSVLYFETIDRPERVLNEVIDEFATAKADLDSSHDLLRHNIEQLQTSIVLLLKHCLEALKQELDHAVDYFTHDNITKQHIASIFMSEQFKSEIANVSLFFQEVRNRGQNIYDGWTSFVEKINAIWNQSLNYKGLKDYYEHVHIQTLLQRYYNVSQTEYEEVSWIRNINDLRYSIGSADTDFETSVDEVKLSLTKFMDSIEVNSKLLKDNFLQLDVFYRQLSYEEITQQKAYGVFALLCDIGGSMGLFVGASVMTVFELIDLFANFAAVRALRK